MIVYKCDSCREEIPVIKKTVFGKEISCLDRGYLDCKEIDLDLINKSSETLLCKRCAKLFSNQIDYELLKFKTSVRHVKLLKRRGD